MKLTITIECHDDDEMLNHLSDLRKKVKGHLVKVEDQDNPKSKSFTHNNCDGFYTAQLDF